LISYLSKGQLYVVAQRNPNDFQAKYLHMVHIQHMLPDDNRFVESLDVDDEQYLSKAPQENYLIHKGIFQYHGKIFKYKRYKLLP
jgi:hypothetical protein